MIRQAVLKRQHADTLELNRVATFPALSPARPGQGRPINGTRQPPTPSENPIIAAIKPIVLGDLAIQVIWQRNGFGLAICAAHSGGSQTTHG